MLLPLLFNIVLETLATAISEEKIITGIQIVEEVKLSLFSDNIILNIENPKGATEKLLELISEFVMLQDTKLIDRSLLHFYTLTMKDQKEKLRKPSNQKEQSI